MDALTTSLRCLAKPATLASIGLLIVNDHVLKAAYPSGLTGKLSDFAGLFFFPFLLAILISLLLRPLRVREDRNPLLAFSATFVWFTLIKVSPWANDLTASMIREGLGLPVLIVRDPTDLVALVSLWPAWQIWKSQEQEATSQSPGKIAYLALGVAALATLATSCLPPARVTHLEEVDQTMYALLNDSQVVASQDGGSSWNLASEVPGQVSSNLEDPVPLPKVECVPGDAQTCYRLTGGEQVEESLDGGQTWQAAWQIPPGRRKFMELYHEKVIGPCGRGFDPRFYDLVVLAGPDGTHSVVVAQGGEGVLVRKTNGQWERIPVLEAMPTPVDASSIAFTRVMMVTNLEILILSGAAISVFWILSIWGWRTLFSQDEALRERFSGAVSRIARIALALLVIAVLLTAVFETLILIVIPLAVGLIFILPLVIWPRFIHASRDPEQAGLLRQRALIAGLGLFPVAWIPFLLWAYGVFAQYNLALILSLVLGVAVLAGSVTLIYRSIQQQS